MSRRTDVDPVSMRPVEEIARKNREFYQAEEKETLISDASFLGVTETEAAARLIAIVNELLAKRIEFLVNTDAEAKSYCEIMKRFGGHSLSARIAAQRLVEQYGKLL